MMCLRLSGHAHPDLRTTVAPVVFFHGCIPAGITIYM